MRQYQEAQRRRQNMPPGLQHHGQGQRQFQQGFGKGMGHVGDEYDEEDDYDEEEMEHLGKNSLIQLKLYRTNRNC